jgi:hypothetical protein
VTAPFPSAVQLAPAAVAVAAGLRLPVFLPQQRQRDAGPTQLAMDVGPIRPRPWKNVSCDVGDALCFSAVRVEAPEIELARAA